MLTRVERPDGLVAWRSPALAAWGVPHLFTTRRGPGGADWGLADLDAAERERLLAEAGAPPASRIATLRQVHGAAVHVVDGASAGPLEGDALVTDRVDRAVLVVAADCVTVLLAADGGRRVAAVHAGWRGLLAGVVDAALAALGGAEVVAAVGPCLSRANCEMGPEVVERFDAAGLGAVVERRPGARDRVDVRAAARLQLERAGAVRVDVSDRCTWADPELWSHRRDVTHGGAAHTGRLRALVAPAS